MPSRAIAVALGALLTVACSGAGHGADAPSPERRVSRIALGTLVEVVVRDPDAARAQRAIDAAFAEIARLEALLSEWRPESDVSRLEHAAGGGWVEVAPDTARVLRRAREIAEATGGAFDPTVLPLVRLWGFAGGPPRVPSERALAEARTRIGWRGLEVDPRRPRARLARRGMAVGLGGIGKGFIADAALARVRAIGVAAAQIAAAGDLAFYGGTAARPWSIAIEDPDRPGEPLATLDLEEGGISTSAPTYRFFDASGRRYSHLLDPRTGRPARGVRSATVVASSATQSDAYSTALFVLGADAPGFLRVHEHLAGLVVFDDGRRFASPELPVRWSGAAREHADPS